MTFRDDRDSDTDRVPGVRDAGDCDETGRWVLDA